MQAAYGLLRELGVAEGRIRYEFFGPATVLKAKSEAARPLPAAQAKAPAAEGGEVVTFARSGLAVPWSEAYGTLLDFAEAQGLEPAFSCRAGICSTCACGIVQGEVEYVAEPLDPPPPGVALLCCARPRGPLVLAL